MSQQELLPNQHKLFRAAFEALGYTPIKNIAAYSKGSSWCSYRSNSIEVSHFAYLDYKPRSKSFSISVGVVNSHEQEVLRRNIHLIQKYIFPAAIGTRFLTQPRPVWTMFDCARAMKWQSLRIPDPLARGTWPQLLDQLVKEFLQPKIWSITTTKQIFDLLSQHEQPFDWIGQNVVFRLAELVVLSKMLGKDPQIANDILQREKEYFHNQTNKIYTPEEMLEAFFQIDVNL